MSENQINTYYVSTKGDDSNPGTLELPFRSINNAVSKVKAGDTIKAISSDATRTTEEIHDYISAMSDVGTSV